MRQPEGLSVRQGMKSPRVKQPVPNSCTKTEIEIKRILIQKENGAGHKALSLTRSKCAETKDSGNVNATVRTHQDFFIWLPPGEIEMENMVNI